MRFKRGLAATAAVALAGLVSASGVAFAAETVDPNAVGSINIHKFEQPATLGDAPDGTVQNTNGLKPLKDVTFKVEKLKCVDLSTNAGWEKASQMVDSLKASTDKFAWAPTGCDLVDAKSAKTDADGDALFADLAVGQYLVTESYSGDLGIKVAPPFLVTVPLATKAGDWNYNVHIYPKNTVSSIEKTADDSKVVKVGDKVSFTITTGLPAGNLTKYVITDTLHKGLTYDSLSIKAGTTTFIEGTDYEVTGSVVVTFKQAGLAKLMAAQQAGASKVETTIETTLNADGINGITNEASYTIDDGNGEHTVSTDPGAKVEVKMGTRAFSKVSEKSAKLAGAKFEVYWTNTPVFSKTNRITGLDGMTKDDLLVSDATGAFSAKGLRYTDWAKNTQLTCDDSTSGTVNPDCKYYWLVETEAPNGYQPLAAPVMFKVNADTSATEIVNVSTASVTGTLPLTGMSGIILMVLVGGLVLGGAGYGMYRVARTKA
ncbi:SpaH/EbpB family LPXTG-anchored major pilin [Actinomycetaceae bacterium WB03_NA08]|uniref:SpaH/EbpB family LPXTG-anchored major pilin n=1 Tax=Scrofimicrobium canadense TaxID=2652290 RepID=A0A6N7W7G3_9ACTO|nr:SpaH/EbpB family LPXTG-anchored major pilin [Scrofimicrobium canadense]MSS84186.1 SpaH/EbpB family LPXTG-anchored major pilin [Scrofimicrobium canadense]